MLKLVLLVALVSTAFARPQAEKDADILRNENDDDANGNFRYAYETSNSIAAVAQGTIKNAQAADPDDQILEIRGCYSYISPDGSPVVVTYVANELGFQPEFTSLSACPDIGTIGQGLRSPAPAPRPAPIPAPRPVPVRPAPVRIPAPAPTQPAVREEDFYKVLDERGNVVAVIPKAQAQAKLQLN